MIRLIKNLSIAVMLFVFSIIFSACTIGNITVNYYLKTGEILQTETYSINQKLVTLPTAPQILGYSFYGWGNSVDTELVVTVPYIVSYNALYAKYRVLDSWFQGAGYSQDFYGEELNWKVEQHEYNTYEILIDDKLSAEGLDISSITVEGENTDFAIKSMRLLDEYANEISDGEEDKNIWMPKSAFVAENVGKYILSIEVETNGSFYINIK